MGAPSLCRATGAAPGSGRRIPAFGLLRVFAQERQQVARVGERRVVGPLQLEGSEFALALDDEVDFRAGLGAQVVEFAGAEILQPLPEFDAHPLLEDRAGIGQHRRGLERQFGGGMAHAYVEEAETLGGEQTLARAAGEGGHAEAHEHVLQQLVVALDGGNGDAGVFRDHGVIEHLARLGGGPLQEAGKRSPVFHECLATEFFLQIDRAIGPKQVGALFLRRGRDAGKFAERQAFQQVSRGNQGSFTPTATGSGERRSDRPFETVALGKRTFGDEERIEVMQEGAPREQVRAGHTELACGTAAQHEPPPLLSLS